MEEFLKLFSVRDILLHVFNTVILFVAIRFLVYKPVRKYLNARTQRVDGMMQDAEAKQKQAEEALEAAQASRREAESAIAKMQTDSAMRAQQIGDELAATAHSQANVILSGAREDAARIKAAAQEEVQAEALAMAVDIAEKIIGRELAEKDNAALAREFLTKVG